MYRSLKQLIHSLKKQPQKEACGEKDEGAIIAQEFQAPPPGGNREAPEERLLSGEELAEQNSALIHVSTFPEGARVFINKQFAGESPCTVQVRASEECMIKVSKQGFLGVILRETMEPGEKKTFSVELDTKPYTYYLDRIAEYGYPIVGMMKHYHGGKTLEKKLIMRHDVDNSAEKALHVAKIEHERGICTTYFFRWTTAAPEIIAEIKAMGHEVGLHYETMAAYAEEHNIQSFDQFTPEMFAQMRQRLKDEIAEFKRRFGDIEIIASHGHSWNRKLGVNNYIGLMRDQNVEDYGIKTCAYGPDFKKLTYISDAGAAWNYPFIPKLESNVYPIYCLIHPDWWVNVE